MMLAGMPRRNGFRQGASPAPSPAGTVLRSSTFGLSRIATRAEEVSAEEFERRSREQARAGAE
jgi:hypothetical protein